VKLLILLAFLYQDTVTVTTYKLVPHDQGKWGTKMASGYKVNVKNPERSRVVAVSRDLLKRYPFGTFIKIEGKGIWKVEDVMAPRFKKRVDLLLGYKQKHNKFNNVIISKYEHQSNLKSSKRRTSSVHRVRTKRIHKQIQNRKASIKRPSVHRQLKRRTLPSSVSKWKA